MKMGILLSVFVVLASTFGTAFAQSGNQSKGSAVQTGAKKQHARTQHMPRASPHSDSPILKIEPQPRSPVIESSLRVAPNGVTLSYYERGALMKEFGQSRTGTYLYDRQGRFDRLEYSDGLSIFATYGENGELISLTSSRGHSVNFSYRHPNIAKAEVSPASNATQFRTALGILLTRANDATAESLQSLTVGQRVDVPLDYNNSETPDGTPIVTVEGTKEEWSPIDLIPIGGTGGGASGGGKQPPRPHPWNKNPYPPDTFTEDYPPFDLPPPACKDWCMRSDTVAHGMCQLIKLPGRRAMCHQRLNEFTASCLRSCDTGDWRWLRGD